MKKKEVKDFIRRSLLKSMEGSVEVTKRCTYMLLLYISRVDLELYYPRICWWWCFNVVDIIPATPFVHSYRVDRCMFMCITLISHVCFQSSISRDDWWSVGWMVITTMTHRCFFTHTFKYEGDDKFSEKEAAQYFIRSLHLRKNHLFCVNVLWSESVILPSHWMCLQVPHLCRYPSILNHLHFYFWFLYYFHVSKKGLQGTIDCSNK